MPDAAWGLPATECKVGSTLVDIRGTVCSVCYALKRRYMLPAVRAKLQARLAGLEHPLWVPAMVLMIRWYVGRHFRWFDTGDLQGEIHLRNICSVARSTPDILHWLPTREYEVVKAVANEIPENLVVRLSANMIDGQPPTFWPLTSSVASEGEIPRGAYSCPAHEQDNYCGACRACWSKDVREVVYELH